MSGTTAVNLLMTYYQDIDNTIDAHCGVNKKYSITGLVRLGKFNLVNNN